ncbi:hypothetical protein [Hymenobacter sp.]|uniref:hypothetical protein n=1 Tax=Hymenobacter sp. TaxID=1898978 RepID=UPI00286BD6E1|nr:hypothetical protein [Hymenobacter sp.]
MSPYSFTTPRTAHFYSLGEPGPAIAHLWVCLHGHDQAVADLAAQLVNLDTPERLLVLPEALSRRADPATSDRPTDALGVWFAPHSVDADLADLTTYLDGLTDHIRARCPAGTPVTVLGYGHGAAAAVGWLAENHLVFERLILYAAVFPPEIDRRTLFAALPQRPIVVVSTTTAFTPEVEGAELVRELLDAGQTARLSYADAGLLTLAALGAGGEARSSRLH